MPLALVTIATITTVYVGIFRPGSIGWGSTYTFDGILAATLVMVALDIYWPSLPEPRLLESITADLTGTRRRLKSTALSPTRAAKQRHKQNGHARGSTARRPRLTRGGGTHRRSGVLQRVLGRLGR